MTVMSLGISGPSSGGIAHFQSINSVFSDVKEMMSGVEDPLFALNLDSILNEARQISQNNQSLDKVKMHLTKLNKLLKKLEGDEKDQSIKAEMSDDLVAIRKSINKVLRTISMLEEQESLIKAADTNPDKKQDAVTKDRINVNTDQILEDIDETIAVQASALHAIQEMSMVLTSQVEFRFHEGQPSKIGDQGIGSATLFEKMFREVQHSQNQLLQHVEFYFLGFVYQRPKIHLTVPAD